MRPMAVGMLVRSLWWVQPAGSSCARVVRAEARASVGGRHSGAAYVADCCKNLVCICAMCGTVSSKCNKLANDECLCARATCLHVKVIMRC